MVATWWSTRRGHRYDAKGGCEYCGHMLVSTMAKCSGHRYRACGEEYDAACEYCGKRVRNDEDPEEKWGIKCLAHVFALGGIKPSAGAAGTHRCCCMMCGLDYHMFSAQLMDISWKMGIGDWNKK